MVQRSRFSFFNQAQIWCSRDPEQHPVSDRFDNVIVLSDEFYREIAAHPIPADLEAVKVQTLKQRIRESQLRASVAVNRELVLLYWRIGGHILVRQERERWGARVIDRLAADLKKAFPEMKGFSPRNLKYMRAFPEAWLEEEFVQAVLAQITWCHNLTLFEKVATKPDRIWYAKATIEHGWSRNVVVHQIETALHKRRGTAVTNFERTLPLPQSDLAQQISKDHTHSIS